MNTHRIILSRFLMAIFFLWKCPVIFYTIFSSILGHSSTVMYRVSQVRIYGIHSQRLETIHSYLIILVNNSIHQVVKTLLKNEEQLSLKIMVFGFSVNCFHILCSLGKCFLLVFVFVKVSTHLSTFSGTKVAVPFSACVVLKRSGSKSSVTYTVILVSKEMSHCTSRW